MDWYLIQQILPPVSHLAECMKGLLQRIISKKFGLDLLVCLILVLKLMKASLLSAFLHHAKYIKKLQLRCMACNTEVNKIMIATAMVSHMLKSGLESCTNPEYPCSQFLGNSRSC